MKRAEDAQLVILSVGEDDEGEYLDVVEDDETLLELSKLFEERLSDDYEIDGSFPPQITRQDFLPGSICCGLYDPTNHSTGARVLRWNADLPAMGRPWRFDEEA